MNRFLRITIVLALVGCGASDPANGDAPPVATDVVFLEQTNHAGLSFATNTAWVPGTLAYELVTNLQARVRQLRAADPAGTNRTPMFTNWWFCLNGCGRNADFWLRDCAGYTASCVWNCIPPGFMINYTALSPRHIISSGHTACLTNHCEIHFVTKNNVLVTNAVIGGVKIPDTGYANLWIGLLASNLPPTIDVAQVVPTNFYSYFSPAAAQTLFRSHRDSDYALLVSCQDRWIWPLTVTNHFIRAGDSGSPIYVLLGTNLVVHSILSGAEIVPNFVPIQSAMDTLSSNLGAPKFKLRTPDLSRYPLIK